MTRTRYVSDQQALDAAIAEYESRGFHLSDHYGDTATLSKIDNGGFLPQFLLFIFAGWWTLGLANVLYAMYRRHVSAEAVEVCVRDDSDD